MTTSDRILREAEFDPRVKRYLLISTTIGLAFTIVGIAVIPFVWILGGPLLDKYFERLSCTLTERKLDVRKGIFTRLESSVPLDKITDLALYQGPLMRHFGLHGIRVETAGQSGGTQMSLIGLIGIHGTREFRDAVLEQRDRVVLQDGGRVAVGAGVAPMPSAPPPAAPSADGDHVLVEIRDALLRIEGKLNR